MERGISGCVSSRLISYISTLLRSLCSSSTKDVRGLNHLCYSCLGWLKRGGFWRRGASLLKGFRALDPVLRLCPPLFFLNTPRLCEPRHFPKACRSRSSRDGWMMKTSLSARNAPEDRGTEVCSAGLVRKSSQRLRIVELQLLPWLVARIPYLVLWGVLCNAS